jgi:carboxymethylenebutenolidase
MGCMITIAASDGHQLTAYEAKPEGAMRGGLVVIQEIFGVNNHIRHIVDGYAANGYHVVAPALFDRVSPGIELGYSQEDIAKGLEIRSKIAWELVLADVTAAQAMLKGAGKLGIVGYCWGGTIAWVSACRLHGFAAASSYYGGGIGNFAQETPSCPVQCHFGDKDQSIPMHEVEKVRNAQQERAEVHLYSAGHGFNCEERSSYHVPSAELARARTLTFFHRHLG